MNYVALAVLALLTGCTAIPIVGDPERMHIPDSRVTHFRQTFHATLDCKTCKGGTVTVDKVAILGCDGPCGG